MWGDCGGTESECRESVNGSGKSRMGNGCRNDLDYGNDRDFCELGCGWVNGLRGFVRRLWSLGCGRENEPCLD
jgi:hypothetical protein